MLRLQVCGMRLAPDANVAPPARVDEVDFQLEEIKKGILDSLGMRKVPDVSKVNTSMIHLRHMMKVFKRSLQYSDEHLGDDDDDSDGDFNSDVAADRIRASVKYFYSLTSNGKSRSLLTHVFTESR